MTSVSRLRIPAFERRDGLREPLAVHLHRLLEHVHLAGKRAQHVLERARRAVRADERTIEQDGVVEMLSKSRKTSGERIAALLVRPRLALLPAPFIQCTDAEHRRVGKQRADLALNKRQYAVGVLLRR